MSAENEIKSLVNTIKPLDKKAMTGAKKKWDSIAKPLNSLGKMESLITLFAGIQSDYRVECKKKALIVMCADNGVVEEGVTQTTQEVTAIVAENFMKEKATVAILCREAKADIFPVDIGIARDTNIINRKIAYGTKNFAKEAAMSRDEAARAVLVGIQMVADLKEKGYSLIATGEMGIGNTTSSSAMASVLLDKDAEEVTGRGAGLSGAGLRKKVEVIRDAIKKHTPDQKDILDVISKVGGLDIAGLCGVFLGGAIYRIPIVIDGFISGVSALAASEMVPDALPYMIASHVSAEPASRMILEALHKEAALTMDMCLGEGSGAVTLFPIIDMALAIYYEMSTFEENNIENYHEFDD